MATETATRDDLVGVSVHEVAVGDRVVLDPIYGMEEVVSVDEHVLDWWGAHANVMQETATKAIRFGLHGRYGEVRYALRFPHEPCVKVVAHRELRA